MARLSAKQRLFIDEYLKCWNATEAARRAGYAGNDNVLAVTGHDNLRIPKISKAINTRLKESAMSADEVLNRLASQARGSIADFVKLNNDGTYTITLGEDNDKSLIKKLKHTRRTIVNSKGDTEITDQYDIELYDAQSALALLGKHHKLFTDRIEHKLADWQKELKAVWDTGEITEADIVDELGEDIARDWFESVGLTFVGVREVKAIEPAEATAESKDES